MQAPGLQRRVNTDSRCHREPIGERSGAHFFHDSGSMHLDRFFCDTKIENLATPSRRRWSSFDYDQRSRTARCTWLTKLGDLAADGSPL
jgi:hypothetical protein